MNWFWQYSADSRFEPLIGSGRAVLAGFALVAITVDATDPVDYSRVVYRVLAVYCLYAAIAAVALWRSPIILLRDRLAMHALDLVVFAGLMALTGGPASPFFGAVMFLIAAAALRWRWRGVGWTAGVALAVFLTIGFVHIRNTPGDLDQFLIRTAYLVLFSAMIGYVAAYEFRLRGETEKLAAWPSAAGRPLLDVIRDSLRRAADVVEAPRAVVMWEEPDEPTRLAWWTAGDFGADRAKPEGSTPVVAQPLATSDFLCQDASSGTAEVLYSNGSTIYRWRGSPLAAEFVERFAIRSVLSVRMGDAGRLFFLDKRRMTSFDFQPGRIVAHHVMASLEHALLIQNFQEIAARDERMRLARDLHDGVLQSLTALALQLEAASRGLDDAARERMHWIQGRLRDVQRRLRVSLSELRPAASPVAGSAHDLGAELRQLGRQLARDWRIAVELHLGDTAELDALSASVTQDLYFIMHEAVSNAARHGRASRVRVDVTLDDGRLKLTVTDNGTGFPFRGRYDEAALRATSLGPVSLRQRVEDSGGRLTIDSRPSGAQLDIELPTVAVGR